MFKKFSRLILIGALVIGLAMSFTALSATRAEAGFSLGKFCNDCLSILWGSCYLRAEILARGLGFCEDLPVGEDCALVCTEIDVNAIVGNCQNPGGQCGGLGNPFYYPTTIGGGGAVGAGDVSGRGSAAVEICWTCDYITDEISSTLTPADKVVLDALCAQQNPGWKHCENPGDSIIYIADTDVTFLGCAQDVSGRYGDADEWYLVHEVTANCTIDTSTFPGSGVVPYDCTQTSSTKYRMSEKKDCPCLDYDSGNPGQCIGE
jgi:hypothetical protein